MSASGKRHETLRAILRGSALFAHLPELAAVDAELLELTRCARVQPERRKRLLQALHSTRALDSSLGALLTSLGVSPDPSLGPRLTQMSNLPAHQRGHMPQAVILAFRKAICDRRNDVVHKADHYPASAFEIDKLVADVETCLATFL